MAGACRAYLEHNYANHKDENRTCYQETFLLINMILLGVQTAFVVVTTQLIVMEMMVF